MNEDSLLRSCFGSLLRSFILRPTSSSALWYFSCRALDARAVARIAALALSSALAAPAMKDRRGRGWGLFFGYPSNILYYFVFIFCTRFIVIIPSILLSCNYLLLLHKSQHIPVHCNQFGWLTCVEKCLQTKIRRRLAAIIAERAARGEIVRLSSLARAR